MKKADVMSDKLNGVKTLVKDKTREYKQKTTSETSNSESTSSSYNALPENAKSKANMKASRINKFNDGATMSDDADDDNRLRNNEEKSSLRSDEYENKKVSVGKRQDKEVGPNSDGDDPHEEHSKPQEEETSSQSPHTDGSDESDVVEHDVKVCDICGDAGREDLLAICCRCPDGAEHTYCMKVMIDKVPEGDWLCEECEMEETKITNRQKNNTETSFEKDQSSDSAVAKASGKRRADELESSSSLKKPALEIPGSSKDVERGKVKPSHQFSSDSHIGSESTEGSHSPAKRPRLQSLRGAFSKSSSFSFPNAKSKTKLVDEAVLKRQKSTKERSFHDTIAPKEMSKSVSFRSTNLGGRFGPSGSKVKMLSPNSAHVQDIRSPINKKERSFERTSSVKLNTSSSAALTPKGDRMLSSRGETNSVSNSEAKVSKGDCKTTSGLKSNNRSVNIGAETLVSQGQLDKQLPSSPTKVGTASSGAISSVEDKPIDNSSKATSKESTNLAETVKENTTGVTVNAGASGVSGQNNKQTKISKDGKNGENKLKDAIEAALLKKPGIYRKNKTSDQPDESSIPTVNNEAAIVDRAPHLRNAGNLTSAEVSPPDWHGQISRNSSVDHSKQSNGNNHKPSMIVPAEGRHSTTGLFNYDNVALSSLSKNSAIPDHECIWQGSFEINRSGKMAEFWDGLQAHLSTCASPRVFEAVNKFPHKILLNGVSRVSAWPTQFENSGVKEDNIAIYFFAKDLESYEKSYQVLLDDMIKGDLALIGSINGVELLIFPSNQLPEKSNRWNMLFFLWGVFRGKKKNPSNQILDKPEKSCVPQSVSSISTDKIPVAENASLIGLNQIPNNPAKSCAQNASLIGLNQIPNNPAESCAQSVSSTATDKIPLAENASLIGYIEKDNHVDLESKVNSKLQNLSDIKATDSVNVAPTSSKEIVPEIHLQNEPKKRPFIDLSDDVDFDGTSQINTWRDVSGRMAEEGNFSKKQKSDFNGQNSVLDIGKTDVGNSNGERYFFPIERGKDQQKKPVFTLDLNEDVTYLGGDDDNIMPKKDDDDDDDVASLSLSLAFSPPDEDKEDNRGKGKWQSGTSMVRFRDMVDK
ncbi:putative chromatin regulator PHD family [Helianthus anomalus]